MSAANSETVTREGERRTDLNFVLGLYDLFAYAIPGFLYVSTCAYVAERAQWIHVTAKSLDGIPEIPLVLGLSIVCYVVGHLTVPLGRGVDQALYRRWPRRDAVASFKQREPTAEGRPYLQHSFAVLLAKAELFDKNVAAEASRLRAIGLMLRNSCVPLFLAFLCAITEIFTSHKRMFAFLLSCIFLLAIVGAFRQGRLLRQWASSKTLEICFWDPDSDRR